MPDFPRSVRFGPLANPPFLPGCWQNPEKPGSRQSGGLGGITQAVDDFEWLKGECKIDVRDSGRDILRIAKTGNSNVKINVRTESSDGRPTLDISLTNPDGTQTITKVRYED